MARTPAFARLRRAVLQAWNADRLGWDNRRLREELEKAKSRRDFLKLSAGLAVSPLVMKVPVLAPARKPATSASDSGDPVLILGAGAAGLAAAYTLSKAALPLPFKILEGSPKVGGRVHTEYDFNSDRQFIELGAELVDTAHVILIGLAKNVGLEVETINGHAAGVESELHFIDGQIYTYEQLVAGLPPFLAAIGAAQSSDVSRTIWDQKTGADFLDTLKGRVDGWILKTIEAAYIGEFGREMKDQSALDIIQQIDPTQTAANFEMFGDSDESKRVKGGNLQLPLKLAEAIDQKRNIVFNARILAIKDKGSRFVVTTQEHGKTVEHVGSAIVCTLPFNMLREVHGISQLGLNPVMLDCIKTLGYGQNSKIMFDFKSRPWLKGAGKTPPYTGLSYDDLGTQNFWETTRAQAGQHGILTNFLGGDAGLKADRKMIESACLPNLQQMIPGIRDQYVKAQVQNWNHAPFHMASYSCFLPGQTTKFSDVLGTPELNGRLYFAGEHISQDFSGFMNGAYETGIAAANGLLGAQSTQKKKASQ